jgi:uncharacterized protein
MAKAEKLLPEISDDKKPYWDAANRHELVLTKCSACGHLRHPLYAGSSYMCPNCNSTKPPEWIKSAGKGKIITWTVVHRAFHPAYADDVPYVVALAELDEGVRMYANVRNIKPEEVRQDLEVEVFFEKLVEDLWLQQFRPAGSETPPIQ